MNPIELRCRREALGLSQSSLADLLDVKQDKVSGWESGKRPIPDGIEAELTDWEETVEDLIDIASEAVEAVESNGGPLVVLAAFSTDEALWVAHPEMDGTPAVLHRVAMARTRAIYPGSCTLSDWPSSVRGAGRDVE